MEDSRIPLSFEEQQKGEELYKNGSVKEVIFSGSSYQIEVSDPELDQDFWVMLQLGAQNEISDHFCTCSKGEEGISCAHLAAAQKRIFLGKEVPLHQRYLDSFWRYLLQIAAKHQSLKPQEGQYFEFRPKTEKGKAKKIEFFETKQDDSFKLSTLSTEELSLYRSGKAHFTTRFEISFWSDIAKWLLNLYETTKEVKIRFEGFDPYLPKKIVVDCIDAELVCALDKKDWPLVIPSLASVDSPIPVYELGDVKIKKITYKNQQFIIDSEPISFKEGHPSVDLDEWIYVHEEGFFAKKSHPLLAERVIEQDKIPYFLEKFPHIITRFLEKYSYDPNPTPAKYQLLFSKEGNLVIAAYLFSPKDITHYFAPWAFIENKGFFRVAKMTFSRLVTTISREQVADFVEKERLWLNQYEGFSIHLASIESKVVYKVQNDQLVIEGEKEEFQEKEGIFDFGRWIFIEGQGFYARGKNVEKRPLFPVTVEKEEISDFIDQHKDELEQIPRFFAKQTFIEKSGLSMQLGPAQQLIISPKFFYKKEYQGEKPTVFGQYVYFPNLGFSELPDKAKLPKKYSQPCIILPEEQGYFFKHEFVRLKPYIVEMDSRLELPSSLDLKLFFVERGDKMNEWHMKFAYVSDLGVCPIHDLWQAIHQFEHRVFSKAGRIELKEQKFPWLAHLPKEAFHQDTVTISTLDWIQLQVMEKVEIAEDFTSKDERFVSDFLGEGTEHELPKLKGLDTKLRPYQELGVRWLWFLYTYGLSGFLCDEMGLGKTHQAMALLAAVMNFREEKKFIVVCPTSVIYHWEQLLKTFLKKARVVMYHGPNRREKDLRLKKDIILTSYGILRSDLEEFSKQRFEVAIFDEIHLAKNQRSQIHKALKGLNADVRIGLTGTPIENHLAELKALFNIVVPNYLPSDTKFRDDFVLPIEREGDVNKQKLLSRLISPFMLRRKKTDVLDDLPEKIEEINYIDLSDEQRKLYKEATMGTESLIEKEGSSSDFYLHVFALINRLKQICNHPALALKDVDNFEKHASGKWDFFVELLEEVRESGQKLVVFSQYLDMLAIMEKHLKKQNIGYASITGSTRDRKEELRRFKEDPKCEVFLASLLAAGVGIDLVSASVVIHYDRWWNPAKENQATDRVHRIGQNRGVSVFKLVCKSTIEEHIHNLIVKKHGLLQNIVSYDLDQEMKKIDREELLHLLKMIKSDVVE